MSTLVLIKRARRKQRCYDRAISDPQRTVRPLRADARRNRDRLVSAASRMFAERGLDVSLEEIASEAQVGIGTLYRRFPSRDDLIVACFEDRVAEYARFAERALAEPDAWTGLCAYVEHVCAMQAADRGFTDVLTRTFPNAKALEKHRRRAYLLWIELVDRAKTQGTLRDDLVPLDLLLVLMANAGVVQAAGRDAPEAWRRLLGLLLDAFRAERARPLPAAPPPRQMVRAMRRLGPSGRPPSRPVS